MHRSIIIPSPDTLYDMANTQITKGMWNPAGCVTEELALDSGDTLQTITTIEGGAKVLIVLLDPSRLMKEILFPKLWLN